MLSAEEKFELIKKIEDAIDPARFQLTDRIEVWPFLKRGTRLALQKWLAQPLTTSDHDQTEAENLLAQHLRHLPLEFNREWLESQPTRTLAHLALVKEELQRGFCSDAIEHFIANDLKDPTQPRFYTHYQAYRETVEALIEKIEHEADQATLKEFAQATAKRFLEQKAREHKLATKGQ